VKSVSIRHSLLRSLVPIALGLGLTIFATTFYGARRAIRLLFQQRLASAVTNVETNLDTFFDQPARLLDLSESWAEFGAIDLADPDAAERLLAPALLHHPEVSGISLFDGRRRAITMRYDDGTWSRGVLAGDGTRIDWVRWIAGRDERVEWTEQLESDPREGEIYVASVERAAARVADPEVPAIAWSAPRELVTGGAGMTASRPFDIDGRVGVITGDVRIDRISEFTARLRVSPHGLVFVLSGAFEFVGLPRGDLWKDPDARAAALLTPGDDVDVPLIKDAGAALRDADENTPPVRFMSGGEPWWGSAVPFALGSNNDHLWITVLIPESDLEGQLWIVRTLIATVTGLMVLAAAARAVVLARRFSEPIERLVEQSERISQGDLEPGVPIVSHIAEVRHLADAQDRMREGVRSLIKLERDLDVARQIQQSTLPDSIPTPDGYEIEAWSEPAEQTGGDTYDVIDAPRGTVMLLADATGHGIGPALSVTQVHAMLRMCARVEMGMADIVRHLNEQLCADLADGRFVTAWIGTLDAPSHTLETFSCGQGPILHYRAATELVSVEEADVPPFGVMADLAAAPAPPRALGPGDVFAVLSDGIFEAPDADGRLFGTERVTAILRAEAGTNAAAILAAIREAVAAFTGGAPPTDDMTAIIIKRVG